MDRKEQMLTELIQMYGFEHTKVITFAWYVENRDIEECERVYNQLVA